MCDEANDFEKLKQIIGKHFGRSLLKLKENHGEEEEEKSVTRVEWESSFWGAYLGTDATEL